MKIYGPGAYLIGVSIKLERGDEIRGLHLHRCYIDNLEVLNDDPCIIDCILDNCTFRSDYLSTVAGLSNE